MIFGTQSGTNTALIGAIALAGICFGVAYNYLINWMHRRGYNEGYVWLQVVIGVAVTLLLAIPLIGLQDVLLLLFLFACTGSPMSIGDIIRYLQARQSFQIHIHGRKLY